ncbi:general stress protein [Aciduricibacillus chroicocephali]|uniref:General stress protein n=1 Tax=Aciduricibacillus chroicocephali TaxID=3054939 RepID=A0ABY9KW65_9BACI|nr:general stress protein [Bacillaceae bacterium 44XB]
MATPDKKYMGTFYSQRELLEAMDALKKQGHTEKDMYVVTNDEQDIRMIRGRTDAEVESAGDENWLEKVKHFIMGEEPVTGAFEKMGYSQEQANRYYAEAKKGGMLLFIDRELDMRNHAGKNNKHLNKELGVSPYRSDEDYFKTNVGAEPATALNHENLDLNNGTTRPHLVKSNKDTLERAASGERVPVNKVNTGDDISRKVIESDRNHHADLDHRLTTSTAETRADINTNPANDTLRKAAAGEWVDKQNVQAGDRISEEMINKNKQGEELDHRLTTNTETGRNLSTRDDSNLKKAAAGEWVDKRNVQAGDRISEEMVNKNKQGEELDHRLTTNYETANNQVSTHDDSTLKKAASGEWVDKEDVQVGDRLSEEMAKKRKENDQELDHRLKDDNSI